MKKKFFVMKSKNVSVTVYQYFRNGEELWIAKVKDKSGRKTLLLSAESVMSLKLIPEIMDGLRYLETGDKK